MFFYWGFGVVHSICGRKEVFQIVGVYNQVYAEIENAHKNR